MPGNYGNIQYRSRGPEMKAIFVDDKLVGDVDHETNTYVTTRKPEHFMIKYNGFGISESVLGELLEEGVKNIKIIYFGKEKIMYSVPIGSYMKSVKTFDFNGDHQYFVSISDMDVVTI